MKRGADDEALSWGDENDPTYVASELDDDLDGAGAEDDGLDHEGDEAAAAEVPGQQELTSPPGWASGAAPTEAVGARNASAVTEARVAQAEADEDASVADELADAESAAAPLSSAALITFGIVGGIYFLYTIGWLVAFLRSGADASTFADSVQAIQGILTIAAPASWFCVTLLVTSPRQLRTRLGWLLIGLFVLVPWPFVTGA